MLQTNGTGRTSDLYESLNETENNGQTINQELDIVSVAKNKSNLQKVLN